MAHGTEQAQFGLGRGENSVTDPVDNSAAGVLDDDFIDIDAADVDVADSAGLTANTNVETVLAEILGRLPYTIDQGADIVIDSDSSAGGNGVGATPATTALIAPVVSGLMYLVEARIVVTATVNAGIELSWTYPAASTMSWAGSIAQAANNFVETTELAIDGALNYKTAALSFDYIDIVGYLTAAASGSLKVFAAQDTAHADNTIVHAESFLRVTPLQ